MAQYTESELFKTLRRVADLYLESYPEDKEALDRFLRWTHSQYGYIYPDANLRKSR